MKRVVNCLAMLMLVFVVNFGFQANAAHADEYKVVQPKPAQECFIQVGQSCQSTLNTGDTLYVSVQPNTKLTAAMQNRSFFNPGVILPTIGSVPQQLVPLQPAEVQTRNYLIAQFSGATFKNVSATTDTPITLNVSLSRQ